MSILPRIVGSRCAQSSGVWLAPSAASARNGHPSGDALNHALEPAFEGHVGRRMRRVTDHLFDHREATGGNYPLQVRPGRRLPVALVQATFVLGSEAGRV